MTERINLLTRLNDGDLVRATKGDAVLQDRVQGVDSGYRTINGVRVSRLMDEGYDIERLERAPEPLPTKPGIYLPYAAYNGETPNVWRLDSKGKWLEMPNLEDCDVRVLPESRVRDALARLVYLGDGTDKRKEYGF